MVRMPKSRSPQSGLEKANRRMAEIDAEVSKLEEKKSVLLAERKQCEAVVEQVRNDARAKVVETVVRKLGPEHEEALMMRLAAMSPDELLKLVGVAPAGANSSAKPAAVAAVA